MPGDYSAQAKNRYRGDICPSCGEECVQPHEDLPECERRWRHVQHTLAACERHYAWEGPTVSALTDDLATVAREHKEAELEQAVQQRFACDGDDWCATREGAMSLLLDPAAECLRLGVSRAAAHTVQRLCAAYILAVSAASDW